MDQDQYNQQNDGDAQGGDPVQPNANMAQADGLQPVQALVPNNQAEAMDEV